MNLPGGLNVVHFQVNVLAWKGPRIESPFVPLRPSIQIINHLKVCIYKYISLSYFQPHLWPGLLGIWKLWIVLFFNHVIPSLLLWSRFWSTHKLIEDIISSSLYTKFTFRDHHLCFFHIRGISLRKTVLRRNLMR